MPPLRKQDKEGVIEEIPYLGYKANRHFGEVDDFLVQIPYIYRLLDAHGIPVVKLEGWEADDLIGTLVKRVHTEEPERIVFIVSSDKDMMQLVDEHTRVLNVAKDNLICDVEKVKALVGVPPCRIIDVMALRGDSSDNVPGAPGIGDKGSVELVLQFGSVEDVIECASQIFKKTYRVTLELNKDAVLVSKHLVTIDCNAPLTLNIADMKIRPVNKEALSALYEELEFKSIPGARNQEAVHPEEKLMSLNLFEEL
jgi:DNA polymerase-1